MTFHYIMYSLCFFVILQRVKTELAEKLTIKTPVKKLSDSFQDKPVWNPTGNYSSAVTKDYLFYIE